jgi:hypothetical protein
VNRSSPITLTLRVPMSVRLGDALEIGVEMRNVSDEPVWMIGVLDGSEVGYRYPHYLPEIGGPGSAPQSESSAECGLVAPLRLTDFRLLSAGETFDPTVAMQGAAYLPIRLFKRFQPQTAGRYDFTLTYSSECRDPDAWLGILEYPGHEAVRKRLLSVPAIRLTAAVAIDVVELGT